MDTAQITEILNQHQIWLDSDRVEGSRAVFRGANLEGADFEAANLREADLRKANLKEANLRSSDLTGTNLKGASLVGADLEGAVYSGAVVKGTILEKEERRQNRESRKKLKKAERELALVMLKKDHEMRRLKSLRKKRERTLSKIVSRHKLWLESNGAEGERASLEGVDLNRVSLKGVNLERAILNRINLEEADLEAANLNGADLRMANLERVNLEGADLEAADLRLASLEGINLEGANLKKADLRMANFTDPCLRSKQEFFVVPPNSNLKNANLEGANCTSADLAWTYLAEANLKNAVLEYADLEKANLEGANLENARLGRAKLTGAKMDNAIMKGASFDQSDGEVTPSQKSKASRNDVLVSCFANYTNKRKSTMVIQCWIHNQPELDDVMGTCSNKRKSKKAKSPPSEKASLVTLEFLPKTMRTSRKLACRRKKVLKHVWWNGKPTFAEFRIALPLKAKYPINEVINIYHEDEIIGQCSISLVGDSGEGFTSQYQPLKRIFVSSSPDDKGIVLPAIKDLKLHGKTPYRAAAKIQSDEDWKGRLNYEVGSRDAFFLYWSKNAAKSDWVMKEWISALGERDIDSIWIHQIDETPLPRKLMKRQLLERCLTMTTIRKTKLLQESLMPKMP